MSWNSLRRGTQIENACLKKEAFRLSVMNRSDEAAALALANEELVAAMLEASALGQQTRRQLKAEQKVKDAEFVDYSSLSRHKKPQAK